MPIGLPEFANNREKRCPVVLRVDTSGSMSGGPMLADSGEDTDRLKLRWSRLYQKLLFLAIDRDTQEIVGCFVGDRT